MSMKHACFPNKPKRCIPDKKLKRDDAKYVFGYIIWIES